MISGAIYHFFCSANGKTYVGSTVRSPKQRMFEHLHLLRHGRHHSPHFQRSFDKYGEESFSFSVVEIVDDANMLLPREQFHMWRAGNKILNGGAISDGILAANEANRGRVQCAKERAMRSRAQRGAIEKGTRVSRIWTDEDRAQHSKVLTGRKMPPVTAETRRNISESLKGRKASINGIKRSVEVRTAHIEKELSSWLTMKAQGMSYRQIERETGRCRRVIARECKKAFL